MCRWPKCSHLLNWFFLPKPGFWEKLFEFLVVEIIFNSISLTYWIQISQNKFHKILLIKIFPTTTRKAHFKFLRNFQLQFNLLLIYSEEIYSIFKNFYTTSPNSFNLILIFREKNYSIFKNFYTTSPNAMKPSLCTPPSPREPREHSKETKNMISSISSVQNKTNKLPCFMDKC
jgi:hypothetical protein